MMPRFRIDDPWRILWQIATSDYLLGAILLALAVALFLATWLPQTTVEELDLDLAWQSELQHRFGGVTWFDTLRPPLQAVGAFYVTDALGFRLLLALLALTLLTRLVDRVEQLWGSWRGGDRPWGELGLVGIYFGSLVVLLGAAVAGTWGWHTPALPLPAGQSVPLGHGTDLVFRLDSLAPDGRSGQGEIWRAEDILVSAGEIAAGRSLEGDGVGVYLVGNGAGLRVEATSSAGQILDLVTGPETTAQKDAALAFTQDTPRHLVGVPEADLVLLLTMLESEQTDPQPQVQVFEAGSGEFILEQTALADTNLTIREVSFSLTSIPFAKVRAVYDRGAFWVQLGALVCVAGSVVWGTSRLLHWRSGQRALQDVAPSSAEAPDAGGGVQAASPGEPSSSGSPPTIGTGA